MGWAALWHFSPVKIIEFGKSQVARLSVKFRDRVGIIDKVQRRSVDTVADKVG
jgi:hypothetical protein